MKYIISRTEEPIKFNLTSSRSVVIDTIVPIQVTDEEYIVLESRLGSQISSVVIPGFSEPVATPVAETPIEETPEGATATAEEVAETPEAESEEIKEDKEE